LNLRVHYEKCNDVLSLRRERVDMSFAELDSWNHEIEQFRRYERKDSDYTRHIVR